jgi:hypothetical protein
MEDKQSVRSSVLSSVRPNKSFMWLNGFERFSREPLLKGRLSVNDLYVKLACLAEVEKIFFVIKYYKPGRWYNKADRTVSLGVF